MRLFAQKTVFGSGRTVLMSAEGQEMATLDWLGHTQALKYQRGQSLSPQGRIVYAAMFGDTPVWVLPPTTGQGVEKLFIRE